MIISSPTIEIFIPSLVNSYGREYLGLDLYSDGTSPVQVIVDTFSVSIPWEKYAYPIEAFTFDIEHAVTSYSPIENDVYVSPNGDDDNDGLTKETAFKSLNTAIERIKTDEDNPKCIYLAEGVYTESAILKSNLIIEGQGSDKTIIEGLLSYANGTGLTLENLQIKNRGLILKKTKATLNNIRISSSVYGCRLEHSDISMKHVILDNESIGLDIRDSSKITLVNSTITDNTSLGISVGTYSSLDMINSICWNPLEDEIYLSNSGKINIAYSDICGGKEGIECLADSQIVWLSGNINVDPLYDSEADIPYQLSENSLCIDQGTTHFVFSSGYEINLELIDYLETAPDMGAYESPYKYITAVEKRYYPNTYSLKQNYPNPFNPITHIQYGLPVVSDVKIIIYNILGQQIKFWYFENKLPAFYEFIWDGTNNQNQKVSTGIYIYQMQAGDFIETKKMVYMK